MYLLSIEMCAASVIVKADDIAYSVHALDIGVQRAFASKIATEDALNVSLRG